MYAVYVTEGIVLKNYESGEVDNFYYVYTKDYGLLGLTATGVRLQKSKLRFSLQPFSHIEVAFVKGKSALRITHAILHKKLENVSEYRLTARFFERLKRMVNGEEKNEELYNLLLESFNRISKNELSTKEKFGFELLYTMRLLNNLGYWAVELGDMPYLNAPIDENLALEGYTKREFFIIRIQKALEESQL